MNLLSNPRHRVIALSALATAVLLVLVLAVVTLGRGGHPTSTADPLGTVPVGATYDSPSPSDSPSSSPSPTPSPTSHKPSPTPAKKKTGATPTRKPITVSLPPVRPPVQSPPPTSPPPGASCPSYTGTPAAKSQVASTISAAAAKSYRPILSNSDSNPPAISVRELLVQGIAWEESGWQSTIVSCDNGVGTMQIMQGTADWMNGNYGTSYDYHTLSGNVSIGTEYLAWLVRYFGDAYFGGNYSLAGNPDKLVLLDVVIAAYQQGPWNVDVNGKLTIPNMWYVNAVEGIMTNQPWTASS